METKKTKFRFANSYQYNISDSEPISLKPSLTIPDQALSVTEIMVKFANGTLSDIQKTIYYEENPTFETDPTRVGSFDLADATIMQNSLGTAKELESKLSDLRKQKQTIIETPQKTPSSPDPTDV